MKIFIERVGKEGKIVTEEIVSLESLMWIDFETEDGSEIRVHFVDGGKKVSVAGRTHSISIEPRAANVVWIKEEKRN